MLLSFINANWYRSYPFKSSATRQDSSGAILSNDVIVSCRITTDPDNIPIYISKVIVNETNISIEFSSSVVIGYANAAITKSNQSIPIVGIIDTVTGFVTIGNIDALVNKQIYIFDQDSGALEESTITVFNPPNIKKLKHINKEITGSATITPANLILSITGNTISLNVLALDDIASRMDKTSSLLTCTNPIISGINSVSPLPGASNNIDIYGIAPVVITTSGGKISIGTDIIVQAVCTPVNIPPLDSTNNYHGDIVTAVDPEWKSWEQYN